MKGLLYLGAAAGALYLYKQRRDKARALAASKTPDAIGEDTANPASVFCRARGGHTEIRQDTEGRSYGVCVFPDGREVAEWAFFRGEAEPAFPGEVPEPEPAPAPAPDPEDCVQPHNQELPSPYTVWIQLGESVELCEVPAAAEVRIPTNQGFAMVGNAEYQREGDKFTFTKPGFYLVGNQERNWGVVVGAVPWIGDPLEGGTPAQPANVVAHVVSTLNLKGIDDLGAALTVTWAGEGAPEVIRAGDLIQFPQKGSYKVGGPNATDPHWKITILPI